MGSCLVSTVLSSRTVHTERTNQQPQSGSGAPVVARREDLFVYEVPFEWVLFKVPTILIRGHELIDCLLIFDQFSSWKIHQLENSWVLFSSSISWIPLIRVSRSARSRSATSSWSRSCSRLDCAYPSRVCPISSAWDSICLFNARMLFPARSVLYSCLRISDFASASNSSLVVFPE